MAAALGGDPVRFMPPPPIKATIEPDRRLVPAYEDAYRRYRALYPLAKAALPGSAQAS